MRGRGWWWVVLVLIAPVQAGEVERLALDRDRIQVWTMRVPGEPLRGFRAVTTVRSSLGALVALLMDTDAAPQWVYRTDHMELLASDAHAGTFRVHARMDFWPLHDRDVVVAGRVAQDPVSRTVTVVSRSASREGPPPAPGILRMKAFEGRWELRPVGSGEVEVTMSGHADPGGYLPAFLVNLVVEEAPYRTLKGLRRMVAAPKYQAARVEGIREPD